MQYVAFGFFVLFLVLAVTGLIAPRRVLPRTWKPGRLKALGLYLLLALFALAAIGAFAPKNDRQQAINNEVQPQGETAPEAPSSADTKVHPTLGRTPEQIVAAFNSVGAQLKSPIRAGKVVMKKGPAADVANLPLNEYLGMLITCNKGQDNACDVMLIGAGDGTPKSGATIFLGIMQLITTFTPDMTSDGRKAILKNLGMLGETPSGIGGTSVVGDIKFSLKTSEAIGLMFSVVAK